MPLVPGSDPRPEPFPDPSNPPPDPNSFAELTPPTNRRRVVAGVAVPVAAFLSWILATATHNNLWYALVALVAVLSGLLYVSADSGEDRHRDRQRNRNR